MSDARNGRKFAVLLWCLPMWALTFGAVVYLYVKFQAVPVALGVSFGTLTSVFPGYLGVNVVQKKIQGGGS